MIHPATEAEKTITPITRAHVELLSPFGDVLAEGELVVRDVPGEGAALSAGQEVALRFDGKRVTLTADHLDARAAYSIRIAGTG